MRLSWWGLIGLCAWVAMHCPGATAGEVSVRDLIETKEISTPTVSPDGRYAAFLVEARNVATNSVKITWYVARLGTEDGETRVVADGGVPMREWLVGSLLSTPAIWSPDGQWIYFRARRHGQVQVWRAARRGGNVQKVTDDAADVYGFAVSPDGRRLYYTVGANRSDIKREERREYLQGVLLTPTVIVAEPVLYNQLNDDGTRATQRRGAIGTDTFELLNERPRRVRVMTIGQAAHDATTADIVDYGKLMKVNKDGWLGVIYGQYFNRGGEYLAASRGSETVFWNRLGARRGVATGQQIIPYQLTLDKNGVKMPCMAQVCLVNVGNFTAPQWRRGSDEVVWASRSQLGGSTLFAWDVDKNTVRTIFTGNAQLGGTAGGERFVFMGCPLAANVAICVTSSTMAPPLLEEINLDTGARKVIFDPNKELREATFAHARDLSWKDRWGKQHVGVLILPRSARRGVRLPLIIVGYHCRGFMEGDLGRMVSPLVLAETGFAVLCSDMNFGLADRAKYPTRSFGPGQQLVNLQIMLDSWESGVRALNGRGLIDTSRVGAAGLSFGSEAVWYALVRSRLISVAAVQGPPWMDPFNYFMYGTAIFNQYAARAMPDPTLPGASGFYAQASVALNADKIAAPVLEHSNQAEFISGMETYTEMNRLKKPYEVYILPDETHEWRQPRHVQVIEERDADWFRFWLQGYEDPAPSKRSQYERWQKLCRMQRREQSAHVTRCVSGGLH